MNAADFQLNVLLPADARFAETMRDLAAHAARYAGCTDQDADRYAAAVEGAVRACLGKAASGAPTRVILRRDGGPLECLVACEVRFEAAAAGGRITVDWRREEGTSMCRIALDL